MAARESNAMEADSSEAEAGEPLSQLVPVAHLESVPDTLDESQSVHEAFARLRSLQLSLERGIGRDAAVRVMQIALGEWRRSVEQTENAYRRRPLWVDRLRVGSGREDLQAFLDRVYGDEKRTASLNLAWVRDHDPTLYQVLRRHARKVLRKSPGHLDYVQTRARRLDEALKSFSVEDYTRAHKLYVRQLRQKKGVG